MEEALRRLGAVLKARGELHSVLVIGGACLLLSGLSTRATRDVDFVGEIIEGQLVSRTDAEAGLLAAVADVARELSLPPGWMNAGPAGLANETLPEGLLERAPRVAYDNLILYLAHRSDLVAFKLYAAADHFGDPLDRHLVDLRMLKPTEHEPQAGAVWARLQDDSTGFAKLLAGVVDVLGASDA